MDALSWLQQYRKLQARMSEGLSDAEQKQLQELEGKIAAFLEPKLKQQPPSHRQSIRVSSHFEVSVMDAAHMKKLYIKNISGGGFYIESPQPLEVGTKIDLRLSLPNSKNPLELKVEVAWSNPKGVGELPPGMGVKFLNLQAEDRNRIQALIDASLEKAIEKKVKRP